MVTEAASWRAILRSLLVKGSRQCCSPHIDGGRAAPDGTALSSAVLVASFPVDGHSPPREG